MNRHLTSKTIKTPNGTSRKSTVLLAVPNINLQEDIFIRTTSIERLDKLAYRFYGDASWWWLIAAANFIGKGTVIVPSNTKLRIPSKTTITELLTKINNER